MPVFFSVLYFPWVGHSGEGKWVLVGSVKGRQNEGRVGW